MPVAMVANFAARGIVSLSASRGIAVASLLQTADLDERLLFEPGTRVPLDAVIRLWEQARRTAGDDGFPLQVAEFLPFGAYKTYDLLLATAPTVGAALTKAAKYNGFVNDAFRPTLQRLRGRVCLEYTNCIDPQCHPPEYIEFIFAYYLLRFRQTTGVDFRPSEIHFRHAPPRDLSRHHRLFQTQLRFHQPATRVFIDPSILRYPQLTADAPTCELLEHYVGTTLSSTGGDDAFTDAVRRSLSRLLPTSDRTIAAVARDLGMSRRALQRTLAARGTSFRQLFSLLRRELALNLLSTPTLNMAEAADALGFSEVSAFSRAFKRWTGSSPQSYRRQRAR